MKCPRLAQAQLQQRQQRQQMPKQAAKQLLLRVDLKRHLLLEPKQLPQGPKHPPPKHPPPKHPPPKHPPPKHLVIRSNLAALRTSPAQSSPVSRPSNFVC